MLIFYIADPSLFAEEYSQLFLEFFRPSRTTDNNLLPSTFPSDRVLPRQWRIYRGPGPPKFLNHKWNVNKPCINYTNVGVTDHAL